MHKCYQKKKKASVTEKWLSILELNASTRCAVNSNNNDASVPHEDILQ